MQLRVGEFEAVSAVVLVTVRDSGKGIEQDQLGRVLTRPLSRHAAAPSASRLLRD